MHPTTPGRRWPTTAAFARLLMIAMAACGFVVPAQAQDTIARGLAILARAPTTCVIEPDGQSTEGGQVDPLETISGVASMTAYPEAYYSLVNPSYGYPTYPRTSKTGGNWFALYDRMRAWGYDCRIVNNAIGSASFGNDMDGLIIDRSAASSNNKIVRAYRAPIGNGDRGFQGDYAAIGGKLFLATTGAQAFAMNNGMPIPGDTVNTSELDYLRVIGSLTTTATGSTAPSSAGITSVGQTLVDGTITWTCVSMSLTYLGWNYTPGGVLAETRAGFDPYGILHRGNEIRRSFGPAKLDIVILENGQADSGSSSAAYAQYLVNAATFHLDHDKGCIVFIGLTFYWPGTATTNYDNLTAGVASAVSTLQATYGAARVKLGANLYQLLGSTGNMGASIGLTGYITADGVLHVTAVPSTGKIEVGQQLGTSTPGGIPGGVKITAQLTGTTGAVGSYQTSATAAYGSSASPLSMISAGRCFAKDYVAAAQIEQDAVHPNAICAIAGGNAWGDTITAAVPRGPISFGYDVPKMPANDNTSEKIAA